METMHIFRRRSLKFLFALIFLAGAVSCSAPESDDDGCGSLREQLDEAVRLQFEADSCDRAMRLYTDVVASYRPDMPAAAKSLVVEGLNRMWFVYYFVWFDYADAAECLERGIDICATDSIESSRLYLNKGITYSMLALRRTHPSEKIFELADVNLKEAHRRAVRSRNVNVADYALLNMIVLYDKVSRPVCGLDTMLRQTVSLHGGRSDSECRFAESLLRIVGDFHAGRPGNVISSVDSHLASNEFTADEIRNKYQLLLYKSRALTDAGRPLEALSLLDSIMAEAKALGLSDVMMPVYELKADACDRAGDMYGASRQRLAFYELRDSLLSEENLMAINELPLIHGIRRYENDLAVRLDTGGKLLSRAIHTCSGMNFSSFINRYRVMEASRMLGNHDDFGHLSIQGIAETVGFKSRTSFIAAFKQFVGMLPSAYRKIAEGNATADTPA